MNFFATGNDSFAAGIDLNFMTPAGSRSENFSRNGQTLYQSFSIAQDVFKQVGCGK